MMPIWTLAAGVALSLLSAILAALATPPFHLWPLIFLAFVPMIVAVPSNDSVPFLAATHYTHLVFRAIENRISLIKADQMRDAAAVDPWGRIVARTVDRDGRRSTLIADLPLGKHNGILVRLGDWVGWLCLGGMTTLLIFSACRRYRGHERQSR
jgi:apolipoprotein N-acyltransferase